MSVHHARNAVVFFRYIGIAKDFLFSLAPMFFVMSVNPSALLPKLISTCTYSGFLALIHVFAFRDVGAGYA